MVVRFEVTIFADHPLYEKSDYYASIASKEFTRPIR